jgi:hypothetical protein
MIINIWAYTALRAGRALRGSAVRSKLLQFTVKYNLIACVWGSILCYPEFILESRCDFLKNFSVQWQKFGFAAPPIPYARGKSFYSASKPFTAWFKESRESEISVRPSTTSRKIADSKSP